MGKILFSVLVVSILLGCQQRVFEANNINILPSVEDISRYPHEFSAHWLTLDTLLLPKGVHSERYYLATVADGKLTALPLTSTVFTADIKVNYPHLTQLQPYQAMIKADDAKQWLKQAVYVFAMDQNQQLTWASTLQTASLLDDLYTKGSDDANEVTDLGASVLREQQTVSFKVWAPTAQQVTLLLFNADKSPLQPASVVMQEDSTTGIWQFTGDISLEQAYYQYQVTVLHPSSQQLETFITTDPYSLSLSVNSQYSQVVDLDHATTQPEGWINHRVPELLQPEDNILYEMHIRDFSAFDANLSESHFRGKYKAFTEQQSAGIKHLKKLRASGLNTLHLLPAFDIATINERTDEVIDLNDDLAKVCRIAPKTSICSTKYQPQISLQKLLSSYVANSAEAQWLVSELRSLDNYNWGYDPYHYTVPEGSYAINPEGISRLVEFREMVLAIHRLGFRVVMDVVYNHTHAAGKTSTAVLDKIVPNYYHRLSPLTGEIEMSTCCYNTATERVMMAKLMTDSLVVWARDYAIDGFRFDLMGHQPKAAMLAAREAVRAVDADSYFYGEGWNFGEVANNSQFEQASQLSLAGSEIGTFSDRLRDAVRGPGMNRTGNDLRRAQGIGNGLFTVPNELQQEQTLAKQADNYYLMMDQIRIGLTGNLANYPLINSQGEAVLGKDIPYGDQPTGYALDPADTINYVAKHDNQTLWDNNQYRINVNVSTDDRVRMQLQSLAFTLLAQGIPFVQMGTELLRSKSFLRDSYDYGDWFNYLDFTMQSHGYGVGLPPAEKDADNWSLISSLLSANQGRDQVNFKHMALSNALFNDLIALRMSSPLFRLTTAEDIINKVRFLNTGKTQQPGLLVMQLDDEISQLDDNYQDIVVIFNVSAEVKSFTYPQADGFILHPIQAAGLDRQVKATQVLANRFVVPALTYAVLVKPRGI